MALDMTSFAPALKQLYPEKRIENMVYKDNPLFALLAKDTNFYGELMKLPIKYGAPQGSSSTFATAQANKTSSLLKAFLITRNKEYAVITSYSIHYTKLYDIPGGSNSLLDTMEPMSKEEEDELLYWSAK